MKNPIRKNVLAFMAIGSAIVVAMAAMFPDHPGAIMSMGALVIGGGLGPIIKDLVLPPVTQEKLGGFIPLSLFKRVVGVAPETPLQVPTIEQPQARLMANPIVLALIAVALTMFMAWFFYVREGAVALVGTPLIFPIVNGLLAVLISVSKDLVSPDPPAEKPDPLVPIEAAEAYMDEKEGGTRRRT